MPLIRLTPKGLLRGVNLTPKYNTGRRLQSVLHGDRNGYSNMMIPGLQQVFMHQSPIRNELICTFNLLSHFDLAYDKPKKNFNNDVPALLGMDISTMVHSVQHWSLKMDFSDYVSFCR